MGKTKKAEKKSGRPKFKDQGDVKVSISHILLRGKVVEKYGKDVIRKFCQEYWEKKYKKEFGN